MYSVQNNVLGILWGGNRNLSDCHARLKYFLQVFNISRNLISTRETSHTAVITIDIFFCELSAVMKLIIMCSITLHTKTNLYEKGLVMAEKRHANTCAEK
jgi:hypothetical protein